MQIRILSLMLGMLFAVPAAWAQPTTDSPVAPSEYLDSIETELAGGGEEDVVDSMDLQAEEAAADQPVEGVGRSRSARIEEIVVSARKRAELLEDTPVSVTALGEQVLREAGITRIDGIQELVPNLRIDTGINGNSTLVRIRGVGTSTPGVAFDPGVGIYVDGVFLPRALGSLMDLVDVGQIEVLRGPQGTLFGKNTVGGAINITTVKPQETVEGFAMVRPGNLGSITTRGMLNVPIDIGWFEDKLFSRFSVATSNDKGYVYNETQDVYHSNRNSIAFLGSLRFLPVDDVTINLSGTWTREHNRNRAAQCVLVRETGLQGRAFEEACRETEPYKVSADTPMLFDLRSYGTWATVSWDIGDLGPLENLQLKSLTSWREQKTRFRGDTDMTVEPLVARAEVGGQIGEYGLPTDGEVGTARQISEEIQVNATALDGRIDFVGGYFVFWEKAFEPTNTVTNIKLRDVPAYIRRNTYAEIAVDNWTWAVYSQATARLTDHINLTAGLRYSEDKKGASIQQWDALPGSPTGGDETYAGSGREIFTRFTPMASLAATMPEDLLDGTTFDHVMTYFTYSQGFKGGGFNAVPGPRVDPGSVEPLPGFGPEILNNFEVGAKTIFLDQRVSANLTFFLGIYDDIQVTSVKDLGDIDGDGVPNQVRVTQNAAAATTRGVELELLARPIEGLTVQGSIGAIDAVYGEFTGAISDYDGSEIDRSGERFAGIPELQTFLSVQYSLPFSPGGPSWLDGYVTPRLEWSYTSAIWYSGRELEQGRQGGVNLLNGRLSYDFLDDQGQVALWSRNMLDEEVIDYVTPLAPTFGVAARFYRQPRTFGAEISYAF